MIEGMIRHAASALLLALAMAAGTAQAGEAVPVRLELLSSPTLSLYVGDVVEAPIRVRVLRRSDDAPLEGVQVEFMVNSELCPPLMTCNLPPAALYGSFARPPGQPAFAISDEQGEAVSPSFRAGALSGSYELAMGVYSLSGQPYTSSGSVTPRVQVQQSGGGLAPPFTRPAIVPVDGRGGQLALLVLILLGAAWTIRRR